MPSSARAPTSRRITPPSSPRPPNPGVPSGSFGTPAVPEAFGHDQPHDATYGATGAAGRGAIRSRAPRQDRGAAQVLRGARCLEGHRPRRSSRREGVDHRPVRVRQDHPAALRQLHREADARPHHDRRRIARAEAQRRAHRRPRRPDAGPPARRHRDGLPALQPVPSPERAEKRHDRPDQGRQGAGRRSRGPRPGSSRQGRAREQGAVLSRADCRVGSSSASPSPAPSRCVPS